MLPHNAQSTMKLDISMFGQSEATRPAKLLLKFSGCSPVQEDHRYKANTHDRRRQRAGSGSGEDEDQGH